MLERRPDLPEFMEGGLENPLGARALYLHQVCVSEAAMQPARSHHDLFAPPGPVTHAARTTKLSAL